MTGGFRSYWAGFTVSQFGDRISELALPLIAVVTLAAGPTEVGLVTAAVWAPNLLAITLGSWVDRQPHRKRLMVTADLIRAAVLCSLPIAAYFGVLTIAQLFAVALIAGAGQTLFSSAYPSFFAAVVDRTDYVTANSRLSTSRSAAFVAGPAIGGALIQALTAPVAILFDALSFVVSAVLIGRIRVAPSPVAASASPLSSLRYVLSERCLRAGLGSATTVNFFGFVAQALIVLFATRELGLSAGLIGLAFGLGAVGGLLGAVAAPALSRRYGLGRMVVLGSILFPAPVALIALAGGPHWLAMGLVAVAEAVSGVGVMLFDINLNSVITAVTPDDMRSRVAGAYGTINYGSRPVGAVIGGFLGSVVGIQATLLVAAVGGVLSCLWLLWSPIPRLSSVDDVALAA
jgi:MFS family permease